ncbi:MAG TPA: hypothetical protein GXX30_00655 [Firmicutes bacterium]|nr:hypothetical protein [Candidatus Fermentithermobacillaceae bacterium]
MRFLEDAVWRYYGWPNDFWASKCALCRDVVARFRKPVPECINCWKIEVWSKGKTIGESLIGLRDELQEELRFGMLDNLAQAITVTVGSAMSKISKCPIQVVRTGLPRVGYPEVPTDFVLIIYATTIGERDRLRRLVCDILCLPTGRAAEIPVRRGCWMYDDVLGPWTTWYPEDRDFAEPVENIRGGPGDRWG